MHPHEYGLRKAAYGVTETLSLLSIGRTSLYELVKCGSLKPVKFGRKTLFYASDLAAFLDRLKAGANESESTVRVPRVRKIVSNPTTLKKE
jgi:excisionase family DNA binding protein